MKRIFLLMYLLIVSLGIHQFFAQNIHSMSETLSRQRQIKNYYNSKPVISAKDKKGNSQYYKLGELTQKAMNLSDFNSDTLLFVTSLSTYEPDICFSLFNSDERCIASYTFQSDTLYRHKSPIPSDCFLINEYRNENLDSLLNMKKVMLPDYILPSTLMLTVAIKDDNRYNIREYIIPYFTMKEMINKKE